MKNSELEAYLTNGVKNLVAGIAKASIKNPTASIFMMKFASANKEANRRRREAEEKGEHIPPFLISSITTSCNLHCKGCYARANHNCFDGTDKTRKMLTAEEWSGVFDEAEQLGIAFILLAGGEPMLRTDVLEKAGVHKKILFPVFTNGTMFSEERLRLLSKYPNLLPVISVEGNAETTDARRGSGTYQKLEESMKELKKRGIVFGVSITVQKENFKEVTGEAFLKTLIANGCKAVVYVEYVPVDDRTAEQAFGDVEREAMAERLSKLRLELPELLFISFPGDEKASGGCLAAGRGFFHINAYGGAEPCPFSAYSDTSLKEVSLKEALSSPLFVKLKESGTLMTEHNGGCVLFEQEETVKSLCSAV